MSSKQGTTRSERKHGGGGGPSGMTTKEFNKSKKSAAQTKYEAQLKAGKKEIQSKIDRERYAAGVAYGSGKISKDRITDVEMFGGKASQYTNEYLVSIGEAKRTGGGGYNLTAKGWKMKYGSYTPGQAQTGAAMGTGNPAGIMTSTPISQPMWKQQQKTKAQNLYRTIGNIFNEDSKVSSESLTKLATFLIDLIYDVILFI